MFNWSKKKKISKDDELRAKLVKSLEGYTSDSNDITDITDTTYTDIKVGNATMRVPKIKAESIEELTLTEFKEDVTVVDFAHADDDPWATANPADTGRWYREENTLIRAKK